MRFDRRRTAIALHILLTAQFTQAGPLRWTRKLYVDLESFPEPQTPKTDNNPNRYPKDVTTTPVGNDYTTSLAPTAAEDGYELRFAERDDSVLTGPSSSATTPRPIFETLTSSIAFPESVMSQSTSSGIPVELVPIVDTTSEAESQPTEATTSAADSIVSTNLAVTPTLTTSIVPEQPSDTTSGAEETTIAVEETSTVLEGTSTALQETSTTPHETSTAVQDSTTAVEETSKPAFTQETSVPILTTSIVPKQPDNETTSSGPIATPTSDNANTSSEPAATPTSAVDTSEVTSIPQATSILTSSIAPKEPATETTSTQLETPGLSTPVATVSAPVDTTTISSSVATAPYKTVSTPRKMPGTAPGSSVINTPLTTLTALPTSETQVTASGSTIYQETPSQATSVSLPGSSTIPDEGLLYSTSATMQSSVDLGGLKPTSTAVEQTTSIIVSSQPAATFSLSTTPIADAPGSSVVSSPQESSVVENLPQTSSMDTSIPGTSESVPETTLTVTVADPGETEPAGSTVVEASSSQFVPSQPASSSEAAIPPSTTSSPATTVSDVVATGAPDTAVPTAAPMPTETATVDADQYAANLAQAKRLNTVYSGLTTESACSANQAACIDDQLAQCNDAGAYVLSTCGENRKCYALPMTTNRGVRLGCEDVDKAEAILGETGGSDGQETSSTVEEPATTSVAEAPVATSAAEEQPNVPVVTVTEVVTVDDGAASQPTSEPANEESTKPVSQPAQPTTTSTTSSEQPVNEQPTETTSVASVPESSAPASQEPTSQEPTSVAPVVTTTSVPVEETSSALPSGNTLTKSIKQPGDSITSEEASEPTSTSEVASKPTTTTAKPSTVVLIPIDSTTTGAPGAAATEAAAEDQARTTTQVVDGTPTVSVFMTVTVTENDHETVTVTEKERVTVVISA
ncbi:hypothetical protein AK830_g5666 [Neonectria ditissima]|uniref:Carbohydrate-binding module family 19 domain-containing protein n=1 Tax=Neonectria ditissima TaxID=78410 RepID=A0A0P7BKB6_9HYPO|nr:hypothetical protein AK830_g5666 [Neonectria ditissima]